MARYHHKTEVPLKDLRQLVVSMRVALAQIEGHVDSLEENGSHTVNTRNWDSANEGAQKLVKFAGALSESIIEEELPDYKKETVKKGKGG